MTFVHLVLAVGAFQVVMAGVWIWALCRSSAKADRDMTAMEARRRIILQKPQQEIAWRVKCGRFPKDAA